MPVTSFVAQREFVWSSQPPPAPPARACPKSKPVPACRKKPRKRPGKPKPKRLPAQCSTVLIGRLEAAIASGLIDLCDEDMPCESLDFTLAELALLQRILFPEEYRDPFAGRAKPKASGTAPGSAERIAEYALRVAGRRVLHVAGDATAHKWSDRGLAIEQRRNGTGVKVVGWADEGEDA
jgi:hypothetical protein